MNEPQLLAEPAWHQARDAAYLTATSLSVKEVPLSEAEGKTLAEDLQTLHPLPAFNTAMMDGYAVSGAGPWRLVGKVLAGYKTQELNHNEAIYIATGAMVPDSAELVIKHEDVQVENEIVKLLNKDAFVLGNHIRVIGDEGKKGEVVLNKGNRINPVVIGLAAASGLDTVKVTENPTVDIVVSGDELISSGIPKDGKVRDSLSLQIPLWVKALDAKVGNQFLISDDLNETVSTINACNSNLILTTGGTAAGNVDFMHQALAQTNFELLINEVKVRPGHPMFLAKNIKGQFLVGLPGNPLAAVVSFLTLAMPLIEKMQGRNLSKLENGELLENAFTSKKEMRLFPVKVKENFVYPQKFWGSMMLRGLAKSTHFAVIPAGGGEKGETVQLLKLPWQV